MKAPLSATTRILAKAVTIAHVRASMPLPAVGEVDEGVERPSAGAAPTAFRIWKAGENPTSKGPTVFSRRSADLLLTDQERRGNLYSIDVDHMSLSDGAPPEHHRAVGWHRLEVRDTNAGPELWAVGVEWTPEIRTALEQSPPGFRYFSPAYDVSMGTGEVVGYLNTALTNNPATYQVTALATMRASEEHQEKGTIMASKSKMTWSAIKAAIDGDDEDAKATAYAAIKAAFPDELEKDGEGGDDDDDKKKDEDEKQDTTATKASEDDDKDEKKDSATVAASLDAKAVEKLVDAKLRAIADNAERDRLLASRKDVGEKLLATLKDEPLPLVRRMLDAIPVAAKRNPAADATVQATRGGGQGDERSPRLAPEERAALDERMGVAPRRASIRREGSAVVFGAMTTEDAQRVLASKGGK